MNRSAAQLLIVALACLASACSSTPPARWEQGGATLLLPNARWERDDEVIEIRRSGEVLEDGTVVFELDRVGRVVDDDRDPVALLLPSGTLAGTDDQGLGHVGHANASPPFGSYAWLSVRPDGAVLRFASDGERSFDGRWEGCQGAALRTCTLVTHLFALRNHGRQPSTSVGIGVGVGF